MSDPIRNSILRSVRKLFGVASPGADDADLLARFVRHRDEAAFELLVWRYAGMVHNVCRQVLGNPADAEDAFQATFLVLLRKAGAITRREALGAWLHRVASRVALRARGRSARETARRHPLDLDAVPAPAAGGLDADVAAMLHEEVSRLPPRYRVPVVCCSRQGGTHEESATQLGWSKGTLAGRLARARALLQRQLTRRGVTLPAVALLAQLATGSAESAPWTGLAEGFLRAVRGSMTKSTAATV